MTWKQSHHTSIWVLDTLLDIRNDCSPDKRLRSDTPGDIQLLNTSELSMNMLLLITYAAASYTNITPFYSVLFFTRWIQELSNVRCKKKKINR